VTDTRFDLDRVVIQHVLDNPMRFANDVRFVPTMREGKPHGVKLYSVRPSSPIAKLGLENVNGHALDGAESALNVYASMRDVQPGQTITVEIERKGKPMTVTYNVRR
jgi:S1-C subfamily serine protease